MVFVHQNGRFVYGNRAMGRLIGAETDEEYAQVFAQYYGSLMTDFTDPDDLEDVAERLAQLTEPGQFFEHGEVRFLLPDGTVKLMEITSIRTSWAGEPAYQVIARDISERKAAEAANRYRASLVAHVSDAIIGIDADGRIESWNEAAQAIYGWRRRRWPGCRSVPWSPPTAPRAPRSSNGDRGSTAARTAPRSTCWCPSTRSSTTTPSPPAGSWCAPS